MGIFDKLFGKKAPPPTDVDKSALGWDAIDAALQRVYPGQEPKHLANGGVRWMHDISGKANPLDGVHVFDAGDYWHYIGLGFTELYAKESQDPTTSGLGYEFTFRLVKDPTKPLPPIWPVELMNGLGRPAMLGKNVFAAFATVQTGPLWKTTTAESSYAGIIFQEDPSLPSTETPHGRVGFLQMVAVDADELAKALGGNGAAVLAELGKHNPHFLASDR